MKLQDVSLHHKKVKIAKAVILAVVIGFTFMVFALPFINTKNHDNLKLIASDKTASELSETSNKSSPHIKKPKFYGFDNQNRPYTVTADSGTQIDKDHAELSNVYSNIKLHKNNESIEMNSDKAELFVSDKKLNLNGNIEINVNSEYKILTNTATVNYNDQNVIGDEVSVEGKIGKINANSFFVDDSYKVITFKNKVHTTLNSN